MALPIAPGIYGIDTTHSQIGFAILHLGISVVRGTFDRFGGAMYVGDDLAGTVVAIEAEMASFNSGNGDRDRHMLGPEWLDVANHPQMTFRSSSIDEVPGGYEMVGDLTIKHITRAVTLAATYNGSNIFPMDRSTHFGFAATGSISRSEFGTSVGVPMLSDDVELMLDVQFVQPPTEG